MMAASGVPMDDEWSVTKDQLTLFQRNLRRLDSVLDHLVSSKVLNDSHRQAVMNRPSSEGIAHLLMLVTRRDSEGRNALISALISTQQFELAKSLNPDLKLDDTKFPAGSSGDGNCLSGEQKNSESESSSVESLLEPPTKESVQKNEAYYRVEKELSSGVPQTDGLIALNVTLCPERPRDFNETECYRHFSKPKGLAIIFNNRRFDKQQKRGNFSQPPLPERLGTDVDCKNMETLLTKLGYQVRIKNDLTAREMIDAISRFSFKSEHEDCDSAVVVVLTHGMEGQLYGADCELIKIDQFVRCLDGRRCPALKDKPKIFIIQACRGERYDEGIDGASLGTDNNDGRDRGSYGDSTYNGENLSRLSELRKLIQAQDEADAKTFQRMPTDANIFIAYATTPGFVSWRNTMKGSWFVQAICEIFARDAHREDIHHLFVKVNNRVSGQLSSTGHKQIPEPSSRLTKKFYFLPGYYEK